uniref:Synembryn n=1 Tax=Denticeps clupeoides TaxID=299321 RepID=A0AAY4CKE9_9TELE
FFFNVEEREMKKFRRNKFRDHSPDVDSDLSDTEDDPDLIQRRRLAAALMWFIRTKLQPQVLRACLRTLRILSRDRLALAPLETDDALMTFAHLGGLTSLPMTSDASEGKEAMKALCNVIYNSQRAQERARSEGENKYFTFLTGRLTNRLPLQERGVSLLTSALEQCLSVKWMDVNEVQSDPTAPPVRKEVSEKAVEILKTLFNVTHDAHRNEPDEEECALYRRLAAVLRHCMLLSCEGEELDVELKGHAVNLLSALPLQCLDVLLSGRLSTSSVEWEGLNMDCVRSLLQFLERRLDAGHKLKEKLTPVLNLLTESSKVHRGTRHYLKQQILPPLRDLSLRPEQGTSVRSRLVRLMTHVDTDIKHCAAELLFVLCKENVRRFVKYTGYGNAAGLLAARGLLSGCGPYHQSQYSSDSDSDSDTEEYRHAKGRINPVTGRVEEEQPDPMEGMTEEEKEAEARKLIWMFNRLSRDKIIQPMGVTAEGRLAPLYVEQRVRPLQEQIREEDSEEDLDE